MHSTVEAYYGLPAIPLQNVLLDGATGAPTDKDLDTFEVELDIELMAALAPRASEILVYEAPNTSLASVIDLYNRIATDDLATEVSSSWYAIAGQGGETGVSSSFRNGENSAFQQMAAQGQSLYVISGDHGAYDGSTSLRVEDPASQPYAVSVGGTELSTNVPGGSWLSETTWHNGPNTTGGGGVSVVWPTPFYQYGYGASSTMRNVPDVSLNSSDASAYSVYVLYKGGWTTAYGTSAAAPLWAAYTALVNQRRLHSGSFVLGFANPALYQIGGARYFAPLYANAFHDIADGSTNGYYAATAGYDNATGWGSFSGAAMMACLAPPALPNFDHTGGPDLIFQDQDTRTYNDPGSGALSTWFLNSGVDYVGNYQYSMQVLGATFVVYDPTHVYYPAPRSYLAGVGDFNSDGAPDVVLQDFSTGAVSFLFLNGTTPAGTDVPHAAPGVDISLPAGRAVVGVGDFNGDGYPDLVLQDSIAGGNAVWLWYMQGTTVVGTTSVNNGVAPVSGRYAIGTGDFNGDGYTDIVFQDQGDRNTGNPGSGAVSVWFMQNTAVIGGEFVSSGVPGLSLYPPAGRYVCSIADINGDAQPDLVFQDSIANGNGVSFWLLQGTIIVGTGTFTASGPQSGRYLVGPH